MGLLDLFKRPKTEQEQYYEDYDKRHSQNTSYQNSANVNTTYNNAYMADSSTAQGFSLTVEDTFSITGRGTVITGRVAYGSISVGDVVTLKCLNGSVRQVKITGIEMFRKILNSASAGDNVGLLLQGLTKADIGQGDILTK